MKIKNDQDYDLQPEPEKKPVPLTPLDVQKKAPGISLSLEELKRLKARSNDPIVLKYVTEQISEIRKEAALKRRDEYFNRRKAAADFEKSKEPEIKRRVKKRIDTALLEHPQKPFASIHEKYEQVVKNLFQTARKNDVYKYTRRLMKLQPDGADLPLQHSLNIEPARPLVLTQKGDQILVYANALGMGTDVKSLTRALDCTTKNTKSSLKLRIGGFIVSPKAGSVLTDEQGIWTAKRQLTRMGIDINEHPWQLYKHLDSKSGIHHYHVLYNRVRLDGKVHYLNAGSIVCNYEASVQDIKLGLEPQVPFPVPHSRDKSEKKMDLNFAAGEHSSTSGRSSFLKAIATFCHGKLNAELREKGKKPILISTLGPEVTLRLEALGHCEMLHGGGFVKLQFFDGPDFIVRHCAS
jgi:hypothetical protein